MWNSFFQIACIFFYRVTGSIAYAQSLKIAGVEKTLFIQILCSQSNCLENDCGTRNMVYRLNFIVFFFSSVLFRPLVIYIFPFLFICLRTDSLSRDVSLILLITFQIVPSCFFIGFVKLEAIKILVWCVLGKIAKSLILTHFRLCYFLV